MQCSPELLSRWSLLLSVGGRTGAGSKFSRGRPAWSRHIPKRLSCNSSGAEARRFILVHVDAYRGVWVQSWVHLGDCVAGRSLMAASHVHPGGAANRGAVARLCSWRRRYLTNATKRSRLPLPRARPHQLGGAMRVGIRGMDLILSRSGRYIDVPGRARRQPGPCEPYTKLPCTLPVTRSKATMTTVCSASPLRACDLGSGVRPYRSSHDSSLEGTGFEPSVPPRKRRPSREARGRPSSSRETTCA